MSDIGQIERATQNRVVSLLHDQLGYEYAGNLEHRSNSNIDEERLRDYLAGRYEAGLADKAIDALQRVATDTTKTLYQRNKDVYELLRYGAKVRDGHGEHTKTVELIDWAKPDANSFAVAEEVTVVGRGGPTTTKRPDIVLYVNGIALGVLELKRSTVSISEGIRQNLDNQRADFIGHFFSTVQWVMAGNDTQGLWYGAIETAEKYFLRWKESSPVDNELDRSLLQMCAKERFLELIHDFIVFDAGIKKLCRPNQYFGVRAAQAHTERREGGIIWHTQGSGKSLTMVWLAKWLKENITGSRVVVVTDRTELDDQIHDVFTDVGESIRRARSGGDLLAVLNDANPWLVCTLIHKFASSRQGGSVDNITEFIKELRASVPEDFSPKGEIFVFVDECHRSQSNLLHAAMKELLPNATFIGFTGTPLLKADKARSIEVFGPYIHTYRFDEAVRDGVVVDLRYEARDIDQRLTSTATIDRWFERKTVGLNDVARAQLKQRWGTMQSVLSSRSRLGQIVSDIILDMNERDRLVSGRGNAMLVANSIAEACSYYELFEQTELKGRCGIVTSYVPATSDLKGETTGEGETVSQRQYDVYCRMIADWFDIRPAEALGRAGDYETAVKKRFVDEPAKMKLLIVVDKLLTGFDAPAATYLYIDKTMRDHALFQAICRVNRLDGDDKKYGYIVDYKDLFKSLRTAVRDYTSEVFDAYEREDVEGLLKGRVEEARKDLDAALEAARALLEPVDPPKGTQECLRYFCAIESGSAEELKANEPRRLALYRHVGTLIRAVAAVAPDYAEAGYSDEEFKAIQDEAGRFEKLRAEVKLASGDYIDLKAYEPAMRHLIDTYIAADPSVKLSDFDDMSFVEMLANRGAAATEDLPNGLKTNRSAVAETIENNVRRVIIDERPVNPRYYEEMSELLDDIIRRRRADSLEYKEYLDLMADLAKKVIDPSAGTHYPERIGTAGRRAIFDFLFRDEALAITVDNTLRSSCQDGWRDNRFKTKRVAQALSAVLDGREVDVDEILELAKAQREY